jgi:hypothetical protein
MADDADKINGQRPDNSTHWPQDPALQLVLGELLTLVGVPSPTVQILGVWHRDHSTPLDPQLRADQLRYLRDHQSIDWQIGWGHIIDGAIQAMASRGRKCSPEQARAFELFNAEVEAGRDPFAPKLAGVIARKLAVEPNTVRRWRDKWAEEREQN